ncbi:MAG: AsmA-like C-terminal region-containing protein [Bacteroidota bacterium]
MRRRIGVILEYIVAFVVIISLLLAIAGVVVVKFYGEDLQNYVLEQVNEQLDTKVYIEDVSVKVFQKFPSTSIVLHNITVWSSHNFNMSDFEGSGADTLLTAETVNISFNLFGMIRGKFNIRQVEIKNGSLQILVDSKGEGNYRLRKEKSEGGETERLIDISQFRLIGFRISLDNQAKKIKADGSLESLELNGKFSRRNTQIKGTLKGSLQEISNKGILYASDREIGARLNMDVKESVFTLKAAHFQIDRVMADVDGKLHVHPGSGIELNLAAAARDLEIHEVLDLLPSELSRPLQEIRGSGNLQVSTRITGMVNSTLTPCIEADFQTSNANLYWERIPFTLKNLNLTGSYSNGGEFNPVTTRLAIESLSAVIGKDHLSGKGEIENFFDPDFSFELEGDIHPDQWLTWYDSIPLDRVSGTVVTDLKVSGSYDRLNPPGQRFLAFDISGGIAMEDVMVRITPDGIPFKELTGSVQINNDFWEPSFSGSFGKTDFSISGTGLNLISYLLDGEEDLVASATFRSDYFDLGEVLSQLPKDSTGGNPTVLFPDNLDLRLEFTIHDFIKELLVAKNVRGIALYDSPFLYVDSLTMQTMEGTLRGSFGMAQDTEGNIVSNVDASLHQLDIRELFEAFHNFGQKQLTHEHLKGSISGTSVFSAQFDPSFAILPGSILSENDITIRNGELNGFSPIMALSRFVEVEELQNIRFETLENTILVRNSQVIIPSMDIQSNALNLSASGSHHFNNRYDYRLRLKLSEILYSKARGSKNTEFDVAEDDSDTRTLFLKVYDNGEGATVEMDRESASRKIKDDLKSEKEELKRILNEELGLFKHKDKENEPEEEEEVTEELFRFEFQEKADTVSTESSNRERGRFWKKKAKSDTLENKPATGFVIDE